MEIQEYGIAAELKRARTLAQELRDEVAEARREAAFLGGKVTGLETYVAELKEEAETLREQKRLRIDDELDAYEEGYEAGSRAAGDQEEEAAEAARDAAREPVAQIWPQDTPS